MNPARTRKDLERLKSIFGEQQIFLHCKNKVANYSWQKVTLDDMTEDSYVDKLLKAPQIAVKCSDEGLLGIDLDSEEVLEETLALNPWLSSTTMVRGKNAKFFVRGPLDLLERKVKIGKFELLWNAYAVIDGYHSGAKRNFEIVNSVPPLKLKKGQLVIPERYEFRIPSEQKDFFSFASSPSSDSYQLEAKTYELNTNSYINLNQLDTTSYINPEKHQVDGIDLELRFEEALKKDDRWASVFSSERGNLLQPLYNALFEACAEEEKGVRNQCLVILVAHLYERFSYQMIEAASVALYSSLGGKREDSLDTHRYETKSQFNAMENTLERKLQNDGRSLYSKLREDNLRSSFRICRGLALWVGECPHGVFYLSNQGLGRRLGISAQAAHRHLLRLRRFKVIEEVEKGHLRGPGQRAKATIYRWMLDGRSSHEPCRLAGTSSI